jgi:hypothetical protein
LWSWRREYGDGAAWSEWLGRVAADEGADRLAALVTGGTAALGGAVAGPQ